MANEVNDHTRLARRDFFFSCIVITVILPIVILRIILDFITPGLEFWPGWSKIHAGWGIQTSSSSDWMDNSWGRFDIHFSQWVNTFFALTFFGFYGMTKENGAVVRDASCALLSRVLRKKFGCRCCSTKNTARDPEYVFLAFDN
jgi:hypothetical protein